ncbi:MAG: hypothetical protein AMS14_11870 [Planctomycetes bacterium DG_20]|nr:MAG: hypothetical protein AMS14_11870 [Planctomycetes bacterium DG_20]
MNDSGALEPRFPRRRISNLKSQISDLKSEISSLESEISNLESQILNFTSHISIAVSGRFRGQLARGRLDHGRLERGWPGRSTLTAPAPGDRP